MSNFRTMKDVRDDKKNSNNRESYVGGEKSGLAVEDNVDLASKIVDKAKQQQQNQTQLPDNADKIDITMYRDGFTLSGSDELRKYDDPKNKKFMEELQKGDVPLEIRKKHPQGLYVNLIDKRSQNQKQEKVKPQKKNYFEGQGVSLGQQQVSKQPQIIKDGKIQLDQSQPVHQLQLRFSDGKKKILDVNKNTTLNQVKLAIGQMIGNSNFIIKKVFPATDITNSKGTLDQLDLIDSTVNIEIKQQLQYKLFE